MQSYYFVHLCTLLMFVGCVCFCCRFKNFLRYLKYLQKLILSDDVIKVDF